MNTETRPSKRTFTGKQLTAATGAVCTYEQAVAEFEKAKTDQFATIRATRVLNAWQYLIAVQDEIDFAFYSAPVGSGFTSPPPTAAVRAAAAVMEANQREASK